MGVCFSNNKNISKKGNNPNGFDFEEILENFTFYLNIPEDQNVKIISIEKEMIDNHIPYRKNKNIWINYLKENDVKFFSKEQVNKNKLTNFNKIKSPTNKVNNYQVNTSVHSIRSNNSNETLKVNNKNKILRKKIGILLEIGLKETKEKFIKILIGGPPNNLRWLIWIGITKSRMKDFDNFSGKVINKNREINTLSENIFKSKFKFSKENFYKNLLDKKLRNSLEDQINKDLHRTAPEIKYFQSEKGMKSLFNVLKAFANYDEEVGYCQGMNLIVANILLVSDGKEKESFGFLLYLFRDLKIRDFYKRGFPKVHMYIYVLKKLIKSHLPKIYAKIEEINITDDVWLFKWIQSLYSLTLDFAIGVRLWDCLVAFGLDFILNFSLGFLFFFEKQILEVEDMVEFVYIFKNYPLLNPKIINNISDITEYREKLINTSLNMKLSELEIINLKKEYENDPNVVNVYLDEASFYSSHSKKTDPHDLDGKLNNLQITPNPLGLNDFKSPLSIFDPEKDSLNFAMNTENVICNSYLDLDHTNQNIEKTTTDENNKNQNNTKIYNKIILTNTLTNFNTFNSKERVTEATRKIDPKFQIDSENSFGNTNSNDSSFNKYFKNKMSSEEKNDVK